MNVLCRILDWVISVAPPTIPTKTCVATPIPTHLLRQSRNMLLAQLISCQLFMSVSWSWYWSASCFSNKTIPAYNQLGSTSATSFNQSKAEPPSSSGCIQLSSYHNNSWLKSLSLCLSQCHQLNQLLTTAESVSYTDSFIFLILLKCVPHTQHQWFSFLFVFEVKMISVSVCKLWPPVSQDSAHRYRNNPFLNLI